MPFKNRRGVTLTEVVIALAIFTVIAIGILQIWRYVSQNSLNLLTKADKFENARAAMDALLMNIQLSDEITLNTNANGTLEQLTLCGLNPEGEPWTYHFNYYPNALPIEKRYRRLDFNTQEFASQLSEIRLIKDGDLLFITVSTDGTEAIILESAADIRYKIFN